MSAAIPFLVGFSLALLIVVVLALLLLLQRSGGSIPGWHWLQRWVDRRGEPDPSATLDRDLRWLADEESLAPVRRTPPVIVDVPPPPDDLYLEIRAGAVAPPLMRRQRLTVDAEGAARFEHRGPPEDPGPVHHVFYLSDGALHELVEVIRSGGFFSARGSEAADIVDGDFLTVRARMDGREHQVSVVNAYEENATEIVRALNALLPETMHVIFSRLEGPEPPLPGGVRWP